MWWRISDRPGLTSSQITSCIHGHFFFHFRLKLRFLSRFLRLREVHQALHLEHIDPVIFHLLLASLHLLPILTLHLPPFNGHFSFHFHPKLRFLSLQVPS